MAKTLDILDLGRRAYQPVFDLQEKMAEQRRADEIPDTLILVEHDAVYTLGCNADEDNIVASESELEERGIDVVKSSRGGDVTYHGPGQLVGYPILNLGEGRANVLWYVKSLEEVLLRTLSSYGIEGHTDRKNRGVWVGSEKVAAIGVRIARAITMHGFALNVCVDLGDYSGIIPCGISDKGVTSLDKLVENVTFDDVKRRVVESFKDVFSYESPE